MSYRPIPVAERFHAKTKECASGCVLWIGTRNKSGYGEVSVDGNMRYAHRVAFELANGPIPPGLFVLHSCDVRACVNVAHLYLGTLTENNRDCVERGRHKQATKTACPRGRAYDEANTYRYRSGRHCRECRRLWTVAHPGYAHDYYMRNRAVA